MVNETRNLEKKIVEVLHMLDRLTYVETLSVLEACRAHIIVMFVKDEMNDGKETAHKG